MSSVRGALGDPGDELVGDRLDGHEHADRHAALAGAAVAGVDGRVGCEVEIGVGKDDHVVLRAAEGLHPLAVRGSRSRRRTRAIGVEPTKLIACDVRALEQRVDRDLVALQHVEDAVGQARPPSTARRSTARRTGPSRWA